MVEFILYVLVSVAVMTSYWIGYRMGFRHGAVYEAEEINQALYEAQLEYKQRLAKTFSYTEHPLQDEDQKP